MDSASSLTSKRSLARYVIGLFEDMECALSLNDPTAAEDFESLALDWWQGVTVHLPGLFDELDELLPSQREALLAAVRRAGSWAPRLRHYDLAQLPSDVAVRVA